MIQTRVCLLPSKHLLIIFHSSLDFRANMQFWCNPPFFSFFTNVSDRELWIPIYHHSSLFYKKDISSKKLFQRAYALNFQFSFAFFPSISVFAFFLLCYIGIHDIQYSGPLYSSSLLNLILFLLSRTHRHKSFDHISSFFIPLWSAFFKSKLNIERWCTKNSLWIKKTHHCSMNILVDFCWFL